MNWLKIGYCIGFAINLGCLQSSLNAAESYSIIDLGDLGGDFARARSINSSGQVVGESLITSPTGVERAFSWTSAGMVDLGTLGGLRSRATDINDSGTVAGWSQNAAGTTLPAVWNGSSITALPTLGGAAATLSAINNSGVAVGTSATASGAAHAALWSGNTVKDLGTLGGNYSVAYDISNTGLVAGSAYDSAGRENACLWNANGAVNLGNLSNGAFTTARGVNDQGQVILWGVPQGANNNHATFWNGDAQSLAVDLGTFGGKESWAYAINNNGSVVGWAENPDATYHAFVWDGAEKIDLGTLDGGYYSSAFGINDNGVIVGFSLDGNGNTHAVQWVPASVPEPSLAIQGLFWGSALALWAIKRRKYSVPTANGSSIRTPGSTEKE